MRKSNLALGAKTVFKGVDPLPCTCSGDKLASSHGGFHNKARDLFLSGLQQLPFFEEE